MKLNPSFVVAFGSLIGNKMISETQFVYAIVLLMLSCHILKYTYAVTDTISQGQRLEYPNTLVSSGQMFELGFFVPTNSKNHYVGIWYKNISEQTVVWLANRDHPFSASAVLSISSDGNLMIREDKIIYLVTDIEPINGNVSATLLDSGNLRVTDDESNILWESFDFPTDTFLPGMKLGYDRRNRKKWSYVSWKSANDPSLGNFTLALDSRQENQVLFLNGKETYWRSKEDEANVFGFPQEMRFRMYTFNFVSEFDMNYLTYNLTRKDDIIRFTINATGQLQQFLWLENEWNLFNSQPGQPCDVYAYCGANSSCTNVSSTYCSCLPGFEPSLPDAWNKGGYVSGCSRKTELLCGNDTNIEGKEDGFLKLSNVLVPKKQLHLEVQSIGECRSSCSTNCNCTGFSYTNENCSFWMGDLISLQQLPANGNLGQEFFLKLAAADLHTRKRTRSKRNRSIIISVTISVPILISALLIWQVKIKKDKRKGEDLLSFELNTSTIPTKNDQSEVKQQRKHKKEVEIPMFSFSSVSAATNDFSISNKLGEGGFGPVYKGKLLKGNEVAVKRLSRKSGQGWDELKNEAMLIAKLQHKNLVKLLGCCIEGDEKILVYEYLPNKSLDFFLFDHKRRAELSWQRRFDIILGIARGLLYLHQDSKLQIIHRDLKARDILLDSNMIPKISDFGLARIFGGNDEETKTNRVVGTYGYMAPEYAIDGKFSVKSDVFSFGVLLLEIVSGKKNRGYNHPDNRHNLLGHAWLLWNEDRALELMDTSLEESYVSSEVVRFIHVGLLCVQEFPQDRPAMSSVLLNLTNEEAALPQPKQPGFFIQRKSCNDFRDTTTKQETITENAVTITKLEAR
ncbi:hypothetical protein PTKIN_Ptkin14bG0094900 [Pterospermum kingtungense]